MANEGKRPRLDVTPGRLPHRVLVATPQPFFSARGTPIATRCLIQALCELGATVDLFTYPIGDDVQIAGMRLFRSRNPFGYRAVSMGFSGRKVLLDVPFMFDLRRLLLSGGYDAVHANEEAALILAQIALPEDCAFVYDMQSSIPDELARFGPLVTGVARRMERHVLERADMVVCSAGLGQVVEERAPGIVHREWIFPAGPSASAHPADVAALRERLRIAADAMVILYAGSFAGYQNADLMAGAVSSVLASGRGVHFIFAGLANAEEEGAFAGKLGAAAAAPQVSLVRRTTRDEIDAYKALADIFLSCRGTVRNVPLKVFELLAAGRPIVANEVPAHRALLDPELAMLVPSTPAGFATGILRLIEEPALARRLGRNAAAFAAEHLRWEDFRALVAEIYGEALRSRSAQRPMVGEALTASGLQG